jgi:hypothetical protein
MRWGIRRTPEQLGRRVEKLTAKNAKLTSDVKIYSDAADKYQDKALVVSTKNAKWQKKLTKATAKKAKYDIKQQKEMARRKPDIDKISEYAGKSAKADMKIRKAQKKIKYNKWSIKSDEYRALARDGAKLIETNTNLINSYNSTMKAIDEGTIKQGRLFMQYMID